MKIAFYNTKPYDKIWFDIVAREEGFEVLYLEENLDIFSLSNAFGCDAVSISEEYVINEMIIKKIKENGIKAVIVRSGFADNGGYGAEKKDGIDIITIPYPARDSLLKSKWVSYLP